MKKRNLFYLCLMMILVSCSPAAAPAPATPTPAIAAPTEAAADTVTIEVMNISTEMAPLYTDVVAEFNKENPQIVVKWTTMPRKDYLETMPVLFESKQSPDIFSWDVGNFSFLLDKGWVKPIAPTGEIPATWYERWPKNSFVNGLNMIDGQPYSFIDGDLQIWGHGYLFYNRELFTKAGLDPNKPPKTWTEFKEACRAIKQKANTYCISIPTDPHSELHRIWAGFAGQTLSENRFDYQQGKPSIDDPRLLKLVEFFQSLYKEDLVFPGQYDNPSARQAFGTGQVAMNMDGPWLKQNLIKLVGEIKIDIGVTTSPTPDEGRQGRQQTGIRTQSSFFVSSQTKHPKEVWTFLEWMTRPDGYYAREFVGRGFGTLYYTDNGKYLKDPFMKQVVAALPSDFRAFYPEPLLACPDLVKSKAFLKMEQHHPDWEFDILFQALTTGVDFKPLAAEVVAKKSEIFKAALEEEKAAGLKVSLDCYTFPDWNPMLDYEFK